MMIMKKVFQIIFFVPLLFTFRSMAQKESATGQFEKRTDIGHPVIKGNLAYDKHAQSYTMEGAGSNMWDKTDQFNFLWKKIKGDFIISATVRFVGKGVNPHRKIGIMARNNLSASSAYADACVHGEMLTSLQFREDDTSGTGQVILPVNNPVAIELERRGNVFHFSAATAGENYKTAVKEIVLNEEVYTGLFICSHEEQVTEKAVFSNVRIIRPAPAGFIPYRDYIGSHLEIMDIETGNRKILHSAPNSLQAPNWTKDGRFLIYNSEGLLYRYRLHDGYIEKLNTGFASRNNNDHVLSFDGKYIGISHHTGPRNTSAIFTLPLEGSDHPKQVTNAEDGHSYLHGWSPDGQRLIFTGQRNNQFDIWTVDLVSGMQTALTDLPTLDDGPEYTPDGKWIYFNSVRTGTMKIWRMKPDGSNQEQVTFDEYNDWFPHISPDGKWMVYISFPKDIDPSDHPFYKKIYLRLMPAAGGVPRTIAYIYGGQGTINVPSWSPDSKQIAFISNSKID